MQQGGVGGGGEGSQSQSQPQYGVPPPRPQGDMTPPATAALTTHMSLGAATEQQQQQQVVEEATPISSRPPAIATASTMGAANLDEFMRLSAASGGGIDEDEADRGGGGASGNRWPRQETLALLQIRSDMDVAFRDATLKGPLWEDVSRKLAEMGYKRSAKKCKEKFENVHKYYKRTKEGRAGRQDGKSYRFFSQLEALHNTSGTGGATSGSNINLSAAAPPHLPITAPPTTSTLDVAPVSIGIPMPISSSARIPPSHHQPQLPTTAAIGVSSSSLFPAQFGAHMAPAAPGADASLGISFSSDGSSSPSSEDGNNDDEMEGRPPNAAVGSSRKRKRQSTSSSSKGETRRMMEFFEGLMKQVMQKQEAMQQRFLEAIEKREQDRMIREEAWKRQEMARLSREHELMAQERAISASRDAAIVSFLQKITGQTIQLPSLTATPTPQPQPPPPQPPEQQSVTVAPLITVTTHAQVPLVPQPQLQATPPQPPRQQQDKIQQQHHQVHHHQRQTPISSDMVLAVPEQQVPPQQEPASGGSMEPASSRWPKIEVLELIKLRSGLESRYQEAGPKGPLWEEISAGMQRMGYNRSAKRCKEKWENINKYFKKVKESNKKRPDDAKTCPYFHELDALYKRKVLGGSTSIAGGSTPSSGFATQQRVPAEQQPPQAEGMILESPTFTKLPTDRGDASQQSNKNEGNGESANKPEDIVKELIQQQGMQPHGQQEHQLRVDDYDHKMEEVDSDNLDQDEEDEYDEEEDGDDDDEELQEERKMAYKIEFQRQNTSATDGGGSGAPSFLAMVQ